MKKEFFKLRHAALVSALALAMGAPLVCADEVPVDTGAEVAVLPTDDATVGEVVTGDVSAPEVIDPAPVDETPVEALPGDDGVVAVDPVPVDAVDLVPVEGGEVAIEDVPVDDCGMACWNAAELPPGAVQKGGEEVDPQILQFGVTGEAPEPTLNVSAELSGAVGVAEQLGAADVALQDAANVDPLAESAPTAAVVATATSSEVNVIRDGHLR